MKPKQGSLKRMGDTLDELLSAFETVEKADVQLRTAVKKARKCLSENTLLQMLEELGVSSAQIEHLHLAMGSQKKAASQCKKAPKKAAKKKTAKPKAEKRVPKPAAKPTREGSPCVKKEGCGRGLDHPGRCYRKRMSANADKEEKKAAPPPKPPPRLKKPQPKPRPQTEDSRHWLPCPDPSKCFHTDGKGHAGDHQPTWVEPAEKCRIRSCGRENGHTDNHYPKALILAR